jgi:hypothetical protein
MTKFKLNTKQIDHSSIKAASFEEYLRNGRVNVITLGQQPVKKQNYFDFDEPGGQQTSRLGSSTRNIFDNGDAANPL